MVFIKKVHSGSKTYYYLVQSISDGRVNISQNTIRRLTPEEANDPTFISKFLQENPKYQKTGIQAIILAAGKSQRLFPYSQDLPKVLIPIEKKTILEHSIDNLHSNGINELFVVTGFQDEKIRRKIKSNVKYIFNPFFTVSNILASVWFALSDMKGPLFILYGDILYNKQIITDLLKDEHDFSVAITTYQGKIGAEKVLVENEYILEANKDIYPNLTSYEYAGIAKFNTTGVGYLKETLEEMSREEGFLTYLFTDILERLILKGHKIFTIHISPDEWIDIDIPKDIHRASNEILPNLLKHR
ncbi:MAG: phosphocholine cytidylyltransferase family protein [Candidatus Heimdallarchaeota archaeon]|nr:phosphocholine cytidylyltransferase family protein [Candidatus Heimdallarchaeota archaeon]